MLKLRVKYHGVDREFNYDPGIYIPRIDEVINFDGINGERFTCRVNGVLYDYKEDKNNERKSLDIYIVADILRYSNLDGWV